jgi:hypothetical protein
MARLHSVQSLFAQGPVYAPSTTMVDCVSVLLLYLRENGYLSLTEEFVQDQLRRRM